MSLKNKTVLITGASSGIGRAFALRCAKDGARIILAARNEEKLKLVGREVENLGGVAVVVPTDVTNPDDIRDLFLKATEDNHILDVVFNNAGLGHVANIWELTVEQIQSMINVNTLGMILVTKFAAEVMQRQKYGHIVMTSSLAGLITLPEWSVYVASKWAITGFADSIRQELIKHNVLVTTVHPGMVNTEFFAKDKANMDVNKLDSNALSPDDVAQDVYNILFTSKRKLIIPTMSKALALMQKYLPSVTESVVSKMTQEVDYNKESIQEDEEVFSYIKSVH